MNTTVKNTITVLKGLQKFVTGVDEKSRCQRHQMSDIKTQIYGFKHTIEAITFVGYPAAIIFIAVTQSLITTIIAIPVLFVVAAIFHGIVTGRCYHLLSESNNGAGCACEEEIVERTKELADALQTTDETKREAVRLAREAIESDELENTRRKTHAIAVHAASRETGEDILSLKVADRMTCYEDEERTSKHDVALRWIRENDEEWIEELGLSEDELQEYATDEFRERLKRRERGVIDV